MGVVQRKPLPSTCKLGGVGVKGQGSRVMASGALHNEVGLCVTVQHGATLLVKRIPNHGIFFIISEIQNSSANPKPGEICVIDYVLFMHFTHLFAFILFS